MKSFFLSALIAFSAWAGPVDDPYYFNATIPYGPYRDQAVNMTLKRAVTVLNGTEYARGIDIPPGHSLIGNFFHNREFYLALVPDNAVKKVYFLSEPFGGIFAHSMLRFQMAKPISLIAKVPTPGEFAQKIYHKKLEQPIELNDLVVSVEATSPPGVPEFSALASFFPTRGLVVRVISLTGRGVSKLLGGKANVFQLELDYSPRETSRALKSAIALSQEYGMSRMYNAAFRNCNSFCFDLLEKARAFGTRSEFALKRFIGSFNALVSRISIFSRLYPPLARLGLKNRQWLVLGGPKLSNLEDDPEFRRLAKTYPVDCIPPLDPVLTSVDDEI